MPRTENEIIDDMKSEAASSPNPLVLEELARELLGVVTPPPPPPDMVLRIRLNNDVGPEIVGYALDHVRAAWRTRDLKPASGTPFPVRNVAGDVVGSWWWGYSQK